jgi:HlyD family secretion protein
MTITSPAGWISLVSVTVLIALAILWGFLGQMPRTVGGQGILIRGGNVYDVVSSGSGIITQICVSANQTVAVGDVVAYIDQPELKLRIRNAEEGLKESKIQSDRALQAEEDIIQLESGSLRQERTNLVQGLDNFAKQIAALENKLARQKEALDKGLITETTYYSTEAELFSVFQAKSQALVRLNQIGSSEMDRRGQIEQQRGARQQRLDEARQGLDLMQQQLLQTSMIKSPYAGVVLELTSDAGNMIAAGMRILSLEKTEADLHTVAFIPAADGKKVRPQMEVRVFLSTVKKEESGYIIGVVRSVLPFPSTQEGMMRVLRNQDMVRHLMEQGTPIEVDIDFIKTGPGTYKWSSAKKTPPITSGTLCQTAIVVEKVRPITLVLPMLSRYLGL